MSIARNDKNSNKTVIGADASKDAIEISVNGKKPTLSKHSKRHPSAHQTTPKEPPDMVVFETTSGYERKQANMLAGAEIAHRRCRPNSRESGNPEFS